MLSDRSPFAQIQAQLPDFRVNTILDVGANLGQSSNKYASLFPAAAIFAFEPVPESYQKAVENLQKFKNVRLYQFAVGSKTGSVNMHMHKTSASNRITSESAGRKVRECEIIRLDDFLDRENIDRINYLKVDTEGFDLDVVEGCGDRLHDIDFIQLEVSLNPENTYHCSFEQVYKILCSNDFRLFGMFQFAPERNLPILRRCNSVFVNRRSICK